MQGFDYYFNETVDFLNTGFHQGFADVNAVLGLIIAFLAVLGMSRWNQLLAMGLFATLVHLVAKVMLPVLTNQVRFELPPDLLQMSYWRMAAALYLGYLVVIAVFFFVKKTMLKGGLKPAH
jgi:ABC-type glycerol-3-phosphate transport system permease component